MVSSSLKIFGIRIHTLELLRLPWTTPKMAAPDWDLPSGAMEISWHSAQPMLNFLNRLISAISPFHRLLTLHSRVCNKATFGELRLMATLHLRISNKALAFTFQKPAQVFP